MKSLEEYISLYEIIEQGQKASGEKYAVVLELAQPVQLFDKSGNALRFLIIEVDNAFALTPNDIGVMKDVAFEVFEVDSSISESIPALVILSLQHQVQGVIRPQEVEDLLRPLAKPTGKAIDNEFSMTELGGDIHVPISIVWICPNHLNIPPFYAYQAGVSIPPCPVCKEKRVPRKRDELLYNPPPKSTVEKTKPKRLPGWFRFWEKKTER